MQEKRAWLIEYKLVLAKAYDVVHKKADILYAPGCLYPYIGAWNSLRPVLRAPLRRLLF